MSAGAFSWKRHGLRPAISDARRGLPYGPDAIKGLSGLQPCEAKAGLHGEMHQRISSLDWSATPVGAVQMWPQSLRATIKTLLASRYPMILLWGPDLIQIYNEAYIGLIGDKHPGALGRSIRETQAESWEVIGPMIADVMSTGVPNWVPAQRLPLERAGYREESYFSLSYSAVEDDQGVITGMLCVCSEVTQQVLGERRTRLLRDLALKSGETRTVDATCRQIAETMAAHSLDVPFARLFLRERDGGFGATPAAAAWPLARAAAGTTVLVEDVDRRMALTGGPWNDVVRTALAMAIPSAERGVSLGVLVAGVSPNRALDEAYTSFYDLLVGQVSIAVRNARAYEDERRRAEALAELDRAKTAFFSNVSHELRTPLTLMLGPLEDLLASGKVSDEARSEIELVHRNAGRLLRLVNTLLDFSRIEAGRIEASFEPTELGAQTTDLASSFRSAVERAGLTLTVECAKLAEPVFVDRDMWEKIVLNLLSNALKFTFEGGITVRLRQAERRAVLEVIDTGTGIPSAELPDIFKRFHQVRTARSRTHEGTGIGLSLVHELVKLHGGEVRVASTEGKGTAFTLSLPLGRAHLPDERLEGAARVRRRRARRHVRGRGAALAARCSRRPASGEHR
jgi:signal transduction histidine kinase